MEPVSPSAGFSCVPSPTEGLLHLIFDQPLNEKTLTICEGNGKELHLEKCTGISNFQVDLSSLASGVYVMRVTDAENMLVRRIIKQ